MSKPPLRACTTKPLGHPRVRRLRTTDVATLHPSRRFCRQELPRRVLSGHSSSTVDDSPSHAQHQRGGPPLGPRSSQNTRMGGPHGLVSQGWPGAAHPASNRTGRGLCNNWLMRCTTKCLFDLYYRAMGHLAILDNPDIVSPTAQR